MNKKEIIKAWRVIYTILQNTGYDKLYEDEIITIVNFIKEKIGSDNNESI